MAPHDKLLVAPGLILPVDFVTETAAILGRRGSGKTHTAGVIYEELHRAGQQAIVLDPLDVWWGLRAGKGGTKTGGLEVVVCGGPHGDVPLDAETGGLFADLVVDEGISAVFSLRHMSKTQQRRWVGEFGERLYDRKGIDSRPLHVFLDEADFFVPQRLHKGGERAFGAVDTLVRRGRSSGIGTTLISQRPAVVNKDVLTQTEVLVSHQITGPQDRKALEAWIEAHDEEGRRGDFLASLAALRQGEAWFWSPALLGIFKRVRVREKTTFDSSATPKAGAAAAAPREIVSVDLTKLMGKLEATRQRAEANDPATLKKRVAALERQLEARDQELMRLRRRLDAGAARAPAAEPEGAKTARVEIARAQAALATAIGALNGRGSAAAPAARVAEVRTTKPAPIVGTVHLVGGGAGTTGPAPPAKQRILNALAWLESVGVAEASRVRAAFIANASPRGGSYARNVAELQAAGLISFPTTGMLALTAAGRARAAVPPRPTTTHELQAMVLERLSSVQGRILATVIQAYPAALSRRQVADRIGAAAGGGSFARNIGMLKALGLVGFPTHGSVAALPVLFLEGR